MSLQLTRQQRRAMARNAAGVDAATDADRRFFERFPHREYRLRRMAHAEAAQLGAMVGGTLLTAPGEAPFVMVRKLAPGVRFRAFVPGPEDEDGSDVPEEAIAILWERHAARHPSIAQREAMLRRAASQPGGPLYQGGA